jgi:gamma-glutamyltranspeptidase/glutathione hydrolase
LANGFPYGQLAKSLRSFETPIRRYPATARHLLPDGRLPSAEEVWHRVGMETTLERIAQAGWRDFYEGETGRRIADAVLDAGGIMTREDMASYSPRVTQPYRVAYRGAEICGSILPNGGISALQALGMMDCFDPCAVDTVEFWHRWAEVLKRVWRDRLYYLGDPDFVDVPVERLLHSEYARGRVESILRFPQHVDLRTADEASGGMHGTLHVSAADGEGNVVSATISQGNGFGSCFLAEGTGVILGHGMCRLDPRPGRPNSVAPRKRPLNNTAPLLVRLPDRDVAMGLPGGRRLVSANAQMAARVVDYGHTPHAAASAARLHVQTHEPLMITECVGEEIVAGLRGLGHSVEAVGSIAGSAHHAEYLRPGGKTRAGGGTWAAGVP